MFNSIFGITGPESLLPKSSTAMPAGLFLTVLLSISACTSQQLYDNYQLSGRQECEKKPIQTQAQCRAQYEVSYREYKKELERIELERRLADE